ncbi:MAG: response regulator transcription factor [bacterium]|nr:response regulator transcription factor [bacterium]
MSGSQEGHDTIRVAVVSARRLIGETIGATLRQEPGIALVDAPFDDAATTPNVDVAIVVCERFTDRQPSPAWATAVPQIVVAPFRDRREVLQAIEHGARGCVSRDAAFSELLAAIQSAARGTGFLCPLVADLVCRPTDDVSERTPPLTQREQDVLELLAEGLSNPEIARLRNLSVRTVHTHRQNIMTKLGVRGAAALVRRAIQLGLVAA